ncbi:MAG: hypothetical protein EXR77_12805 [Myxococcales bacterium]|nr:hypothetical protein [Myxococcales bacterium]
MVSVSFRILLLLALTVVACACAASATPTNDAAATSVDASADSTAVAVATYKPFDQANADPYLQRVFAYEQIKGIVGATVLSSGQFGGDCSKYSPTATTASDPSKLASLYVESATLQTSVLKRKDKHADNGGADLGKAIDAQICASLAAGATTTAAADAIGGVQWHGQLIVKGLLHYFYAAWYGYLASGNRKDWDEAMAAWGKSFDGKVDSGLAALAAKRDAQCGTQLGKDIWSKLLSGRAILADALTKEGKAGNADTLATLPTELKALQTAVDGQLQQVFALSLGHELVQIQAGTAVAVKLAEARAFWRILKPRVAAFDKAKGTQHLIILDLVEQDDPSKIKPSEGLAAIQAVWGVDVAAACK